MKKSEWEILEAIDLLERRGYVVRKLAEADIESVLEVVPLPEDCYRVAVRVDATVNGKHMALAERFPAELLLDQDHSEFRHRHAPRILADKLGMFLSGAMLPGIEAQMREKVDPLVPERRMSLAEIQSFIERALKETRL